MKSMKGSAVKNRSAIPGDKVDKATKMFPAVKKVMAKATSTKPAPKRAGTTVQSTHFGKAKHGHTGSANKPKGAQIT